MMRSFGMGAWIVSTLALAAGAADVSPTDVVFVRQAARRWVFDPGSGIPLWGLYPDRVVGGEVMHPVVRQEGEGTTFTFTLPLASHAMG